MVSISSVGESPRLVSCFLVKIDMANRRQHRVIAKETEFAFSYSTLDLTRLDQMLYNTPYTLDNFECSLGDD